MNCNFFFHFTMIIMIWTHHFLHFSWKKINVLWMKNVNHHHHRVKTFFRFQIHFEMKNFSFSPTVWLWLLFWLWFLQSSCQWNQTRNQKNQYLNVIHIISQSVIQSSFSFCFKFRVCFLFLSFWILNFFSGFSIFKCFSTEKKSGFDRSIDQDIDRFFPIQSMSMCFFIRFCCCLLLNFFFESLSSLKWLIQ